MFCSVSPEDLRLREFQDMAGIRFWIVNKTNHPRHFSGASRDAEKPDLIAMYQVLAVALGQTIAQPVFNGGDRLSRKPDGQEIGVRLQLGNVHF